MAKEKKCYKVVIASPSDVSEERKITVEAIRLTNSIFKDSDVLLESYMWETDAFPSFHPEGPQGVIDKALNIENSDIFIGLFYLRFGTPTQSSESGTIHEIKQAIDAFENKGTPEVKLFFKKPTNSVLNKLNEDEFNQYRKVKDFQKEMYSKGIIGDFKKLDEFKDKLILDLTKFLLIKSGIVPREEKELKKETIKVEDEIKFAKAIGSNRKLILNLENYNLSNLDYLRGSTIYHEEVHDGLEIIIDGVENLSIIGSEDKSKLFVTPQYANVLTFRNSECITITNIIAGHDSKPGYCDGGVLVFKNCKNIIIKDSILFGCGVEGLKLDNVETFIFKNSIIRECNQGIMSISKSNNVYFRESTFEKNQLIFYGVGIGNFAFIEFEGCLFKDNSSYKDSDIIKSELISPSINSNVLIRNSKMINNDISYLARRRSLLNLENVYTKNNKFKI